MSDADQANQLEAEFFGIVDEGKPGQHRTLRASKSIDEFNQQHGVIWNNHEAELIAEGLMKAPLPPEPKRDPLAEIDELKAGQVKINEKLNLLLKK